MAPHFYLQKDMAPFFEPLWLNIFWGEPKIEILAQTVYVFLQNKKAVT